MNTGTRSLIHKDTVLIFHFRGKLTQAQAATKAGVGRTVITAIVNGNLESISTDRLIDVAHSLGLRVQLKVA